MDSRKLISFGNSSMVISLPAAWLRKNKLKKGDEIFVSEKDNDLLLSKRENGKKDLKFATIDVDDKELAIVKMEIISSYISNHDVIEVINRKKKYPEELRYIIHNLAGVEIIDESATKIVIKYLMDIKELSLEGLIRRMDVIVRSMIEDMLKCHKEDLHDSVYERDVNINRLALLAHRTIRFAFETPEIAKAFNMNNTDLLNSFDVVNNLEKIGDQTKRISMLMASDKISKKTKTDLEKILEKLNSRYLKTMKAYYSKNKEIAYSIEMETSELIHECSRLMTKKNEIETIRVAELCKGFISHTKIISRTIIDA